MHITQLTLEIRHLKYCPEHIKTCAQWSFDTWGHYTPDKTMSDFIVSRKKYLNDKTLPFTLVAFDGKKTPIGMCSLTVTRGILPALTPWLAALYVQPEYRNKGIGKLLEHATCAQASHMGYAQIYCFTSDKSIVSWYKKLEWRQRGKEYLHNHEITVLEKSLQ